MDLYSCFFTFAVLLLVPANAWKKERGKLQRILDLRISLARKSRLRREASQQKSKPYLLRAPISQHKELETKYLFSLCSEQSLQPQNQTSRRKSQLSRLDTWLSLRAFVLAFVSGSFFFMRFWFSFCCSWLAKFQVARQCIKHRSVCIIFLSEFKHCLPLCYLDLLWEYLSAFLQSVAQYYTQTQSLLLLQLLLNKTFRLNCSSIHFSPMVEAELGIQFNYSCQSSFSTCDCEKHEARKSRQITNRNQIMPKNDTKNL